jgi:glycosyltransferase involved in cell wall biosynthesis
MSKQQCADCFTSTSYFEEIIARTRARLETLHSFPITVLSKYMKEELVAVGLSAERIHVIGPFVHDLPRVDAGPRDRILFVGRLTRAKGVHAAASAWRKSGVGVPLVFAGTGSERNQLEANGFEVTGWLNRQALSEQYSRAAAVIMPSYWQEPYGIVGLEAASLGIPVVTWRSGGIPEWSSPEFTVDWGDIDQLAACLKKAVAGSTVAHKAVNPDIAMSQLFSLYEDMIQGSYGR